MLLFTSTSSSIPETLLALAVSRNWAKVKNLPAFLALGFLFRPA